MTALYIVLGVLFLIFLPILWIYFPYVFGSPQTPTSQNENYDLNPNKRKVGESTEEYKKRLKKIEIKKNDQITFKSLFRSVFIGVIIFIVISLFYFLNL